MADSEGAFLITPKAIDELEIGPTSIYTTPIEYTQDANNERKSAKFIILNEIQTLIATLRKVYKPSPNQLMPIILSSSTPAAGVLSKDGNKNSSYYSKFEKKSLTPQTESNNHQPAVSSDDDTSRIKSEIPISTHDKPETPNDMHGTDQEIEKVDLSLKNLSILEEQYAIPSRFNKALQTDSKQEEESSLAKFLELAQFGKFDVYAAIKSFVNLKESILKSNNLDITIMKAFTIFKPFLNIIIAPHVSGLLTAKALNAAKRILSLTSIIYGFSDYKEAIEALSLSVTQCRFESSDPTQDEYVLFAILSLMEDLIANHIPLLPPKPVIEVCETMIGMSCQPRLSDLFRRTACESLHKSVRNIQLHTKSILKENASTAFGHEMTVMKKSAYEIRKEFLKIIIKVIDIDDIYGSDNDRAVALRLLLNTLELDGNWYVQTENKEIYELIFEKAMKSLAFLSRSAVSTNMILASRIIQKLLSLAPDLMQIQFEFFLKLILVRCYPSIDSSVVSETLNNLGKFDYDKPIFKNNNNSASTEPAAILQASGATSSLSSKHLLNENVERLIEQTMQFVEFPDFLPWLFITYDCNPEYSLDAFQEFVRMVTRNVLLDNATQPSAPYIIALSIDTLSTIVEYIHEKIRASNESESSLVTQILADYNRKRSLIDAYTEFSKNPKKGEKCFQEHITDSKSLVYLLKDTARIDHKALGEFFAKPSNGGILDSYLSTFSFDNLRFDEALRIFMQTFRLPGEAQQIERIVEKFSEHYAKAQHDDSSLKIAPESGFVLAYAIIILNVDLHSPKLKKRMTIDDFKVNLRGLNDGKDFPPEYLEDIFDNIKASEMIIPEEHDNKISFDMLWARHYSFLSENKEKLIISQSHLPELIHCEGLFRQMFQISYEPMILALLQVFSGSQDDSVYSQVISSLDQCIEIAQMLNLNRPADSIISSISQFSSFRQKRFLDYTLNVKIETQDRTFFVSPLSVLLGRDFKSQLAIVVLFRLIYQHETAFSNIGWESIFDVIKHLFINGLISPDISPMLQTMDIDPIPYPKKTIKTFKKSTTESKGDATSPGSSGFLSALSLYLSNYSDDPEMPNDEDIESSSCAVDCISCCRIDLVFRNFLEVNAETALTIINALLPDIRDLADEIDSPVQNLKPCKFGGLCDSNDSVKTIEIADTYYYMFKLEVALSLAIREKSVFQSKARGIVCSAFTLISSKHLSASNVIRPILYILRILRAQEDFGLTIIRASDCCDLICRIPKNVLSSSLEGRDLVLLASALLLCLQGDKRLELVQSTEFFQALTIIARSCFKTHRIVFEIICVIISSENLSLLIIPDVLKLIGVLISLEDRMSEAKLQTLNRRHKHKRTSSDNATGTEVSQELFGHKAIGKIFNVYMFLITDSFLQADLNLAFDKYFKPLLIQLLCYFFSNSRLIRQQAFRLFSESIRVFCEKFPDQTNLKFRLFEEVLLKPAFSGDSQNDRILETFNNTSRSLVEPYIDMTGMWCKLFLQHFVDRHVHQKDSSLQSDNIDLRTKQLLHSILRQIDEFVSQFPEDALLLEAATENIKNLLLILESSSSSAKLLEDADYRQSLLDILNPKFSVCSDIITNIATAKIED